MALSITALSDSNTNGAGNGTFTSGVFTPPNNCLLVVFVVVACDCYLTPTNLGTTPSLSGGGLTWTRQIWEPDNTSNHYPCGIGVFTAPVTTGASMSLTLSALGLTSANTAYPSFRVNYVTGYNTSTPTGATAVGASLGTGAVSITLSGAPAASSIIVAGITDTAHNDTQTGITGGTGWTTLNAYENVQGYWTLDATQYNTGTTSTTVPWQVACVSDTYETQAACALEILAAAGGGPTTPKDCSFLFEPTPLLTHPQTVNTSQSSNAEFMGWNKNPTPTQLAFWEQPPFLGPVPKSTQNTNQSFVYNPPSGAVTPSAFWLEPTPDLQRHVPTIYTAQIFIGNPTIGPPVPGWYTQAPDLLRHPNTLDTNQPFNAGFAGRAGATPSALGFWTQPQDLFRHPATLDTNQPCSDAFAGWAKNLTPTSLGFWQQPQDLLKHPATLDTRQPFEYNPPAGTVTPGDCSFLFQPSALLNHAQTLDTNQPLNDAFFGWANNLTPTALGWYTQAQDLLNHPKPLDTNQSRVSYQVQAEPAQDVAFWVQPPTLLPHAPVVDTNQPVVTRSSAAPQHG